VLRQWEDQILAGDGDPDAGERAALERLLDLNLVGTPDQVADRIVGLFEATGVRHLVVGFEGTGDRELALESMRRFADEVMPQVRARIGLTAASA
jgi:alkanesulfonate monooxygenase SsuD/methylene tetrahydromethanopterin reductase-like flavin-dependent oxidoreductase (luciferase family)